jgi:nicotinamide riboside transporter PnuC
MLTPQCGVVYFVIVLFIGWYIWFRDEGQHEIQDVFNDMVGKKSNEDSEKK